MSQRPEKPCAASVSSFFVGDLIETVDLAPVLLRELIEPDVHGLGDEHDVRHPVEVLAEALRLGLGAAELHRVEKGGARAGGQPR